MKKLFLTTAMVVLLPFSASAVGLDDVKGLAKGADCNAKAASIISSGGKEALSLYEDVKSGKEISVDNGELVDDLKAYVKDGCAADHLKKAIAAAGY